ncbi:MAG TPA: aldo/keto reductase [Steroidobacteraceae bacterium]|nr:aldo/keto reductase [Steroidobacteraceae bacterium]
MTGPSSASGIFRFGPPTGINRLGFGAMRVTGRSIWGPPGNRGNAIRVLRRAVELGVSLIDTADSYGPNVSEELIAEALHPYPAGLVIATKGGLTRPSPGDWHRDARPQHLVSACEGSLKRLKLECIELYQLHAPDPKVPFAESVGALLQLQRQGKIRHIGVSNVNVAQLAQARAIVEVVSVQNRYNLGERTHDDVLEVCQRDHIAFLPWAPLASGSIAGASRAAARVAARLGVTQAQVVLAWLLARSPVMVPIPGTASMAHLEENCAATRLTLSDAVQAELARG